ncbi:hypothetical protein [Streptomyces sp. SP18CS02]|uniref:hypothetical protein n=1 Tax=Streptomyces sp. SP18CS02 TaxID=3002531 RepID=UPI002E768B48|nr:hypothetical protein [Streptomyces sp. SP18CS02]MEE1756298.1 hypothetical protein [Streptomyces sp. SP18CS02]
MTATGTPFAVTDALAAVDALLVRPVPAAGPTGWDPDPPDGEWTGSLGAGFRLVPLWRSRDHFGVPAREWDAAQEEAGANLAALAAALDARWGPHRTVGMRPFLLRGTAGRPMPPLLAELCAFDLYGDLRVWGPVGTPHGPRWAAVSVGQCDDDAPHLMVAALSDAPLIEPDD